MLPVPTLLLKGRPLSVRKQHTRKLPPYHPTRHQFHLEGDSTAFIHRLEAEGYQQLPAKPHGSIITLISPPAGGKGGLAFVTIWPSGNVTLDGTRRREAVQMLERIMQEGAQDKEAS